MAKPFYVVVADTDPDITTMIEEVLLFEGYTVRPLNRANLSVYLIERIMPRLLLLDLTYDCPTNTLSLLHDLRSTNATCDIAVVVTSTESRDLEQLAEPLAQLDCQPLLKPFTLDDLFDSISQANTLIGNSARVIEASPSLRLPDSSFTIGMAHRGTLHTN